MITGDEKIEEQIAAIRANYERAVPVEVGIDWDGFTYSLRQLVAFVKRVALDKI
jgi:hypothetical protein